MRSMNHPNLIKIFEVIDHTSKACVGGNGVGNRTPRPGVGVGIHPPSHAGCNTGSLDTRVVPAMPALLQVVFVMEYAEAGPVAQVLPQGPFARRLRLRHAACIVLVPALPLYHLVPCHVMPFHVNAMPCHAMPCHATPCWGCLIGGACAVLPRSRTS